MLAQPLADVAIYLFSDMIVIYSASGYSSLLLVLLQAMLSTTRASLHKAQDEASTAWVSLGLPPVYVVHSPSFA